MDNYLKNNNIQISGLTARKSSLGSVQREKLDPSMDRTGRNEMVSHLKNIIHTHSSALNNKVKTPPR